MLVTVGIDCGFKQALLSLAEKQLTLKQRIILERASMGAESITSLVRVLSQKLDCSRSGLWVSVKQLVSFGLLSCGEGKVCLTMVGEVILESFKIEKCIGGDI